MNKQYKFGVIGAGFMSHAILKGIVDNNFLSPDQIICADISLYALNRMSDELKISTTTNNLEVANNSEFILFAIKPQNFPAVAEEIKSANPKKIISIMAGVKRSKIKIYFNDNCKVARCMPNLPCSIGKGAMGIDITDYNDKNDFDFIKNIFSCLGEVMPLTEDKLDAVTGVSGSGPAYVYLFIKSLIDAGVEQGLSENEAKTLAIQTVIGGAEMAKVTTDKSLDDLIKAVSSKGGTTIEAMKSFENDGFCEIVKRAVKAATDRSKELSK